MGKCWSEEEVGMVGEVVLRKGNVDASSIFHCFPLEAAHTHI